MIPGEDSPNLGKRFEAEHSFKSTDAEDLTFEKGDIIVATDTEGDWWQGRLEKDGTNGKVGSFPHNYVKPVESTNAEKGDNTQKETRLVALHNYHNSEEGDLRFDKGDVLIGTSLHNQWWTGRHTKTNKKGDFPANYVKEVPADSTSNPDTSHDSKSTPQSRTQTKRLVALHNFASTEEGDLPFKKGDILIGVELNGDWWEGRLEKGGKTGSFPRNYVTDAPVKSKPETQSVQKEKSKPSSETESSRRRREEAAIRIQKIQRGRQARKRVKKMKIGSAKDARKNYEERERERERKEDEAYKRKHAATKIQAVQRGRRDRRRDKERRKRAAEKRTSNSNDGHEDVKREQAATKIQALQRGKKGRQRAQRLRRERERRRRERENKAATKIQAVQRGRQCRNRLGLHKNASYNEEGAEAHREDAESNRILPLKPYVTMDELKSVFNSWDLDGDEVLTAEEIRISIEKGDQENRPSTDLTLPRLQTARIQRHIEKYKEEHHNLDYQYWDLNDFIEMAQTPLTDARWSNSKTVQKKKQEKRWAPKTTQFEDDDGNTRLRHTTGSKPLTKDEFIEIYHGLKEWEKAMVKISPSDAKQRQLRMKKQMKKQGVSSMLSVDKLNQIRLRLKQRCTTHSGIDVGNVMPRRRWPVDRDAEPDEDGNQPRLPVSYEAMQEALKVILKSRLSTDKQFAGFWEYLATEREDFVTFEEFTRFVTFKPRKKVRKRMSVDMSAAAQSANFSSGFRPDNNSKSSGAFVSKSKAIESKDVNPVFIAFQQHIEEAGWREDLLREHFHVFDKDGDGTITREEFRIGFQSLGIPHKQSDLDIIVTVLDMNHDDVIDYDEFSTQLFEDPEKIFKEIKEKRQAQQKAQEQKQKQSIADSHLIEGIIAPQVPEDQLMEREDLEQIRLRLRTECTTPRGIDVAEVFPRRKWPGKGPMGHVSYADMRIHMRNKFPNRLSQINKWAYASFWMYLGTDDPNNVTLDEFTRFVSLVPSKRYVRRKSVDMSTSETVAGFSTTFRPDVNTSTAKSKEMAARKEKKRKEKVSHEDIKKELNQNWTKSTPKARPPSVSTGSSNIGANLKAAAFGKKIMNLKFARKFGDNKLDQDEIRLIKNKIRAASYKKGGADLNKLFAEWDKDKNEYLDYDELAVAVAKLLPKKSMLSKSEMMQLCKLFDKDNDRRVSVVEFKEFLVEDVYKSKRKKRSEMDVKEFKSNREIVNSITGMFRGSGTVAGKLKQKIKKKKVQPKKALWRKNRANSFEKAASTTESDNSAKGGDDATSDVTLQSTGRVSQLSNASNSSDASRATQYEGGGYDMMGRKIPLVVIPGKRSKTTVELQNALKTIPQEEAPPLPDRVQMSDMKGGRWFCDTDSGPSDEDEDNNANITQSAPRMTPIVKHRMRNRQKNMSNLMLYQSSWDEPVNSTGNVNPEIESSTRRKTVVSGSYSVKMTRNAERNSQWFKETDAGASTLMDAKTLARNDGQSGDINMTLYRRKWNEQQPGDGSVKNPWRVGVKTSWT